MDAGAALLPAGDPYEVTRADVDNALRVEVRLVPLAAAVLVPARPGKHCFSLPSQ